MPTDHASRNSEDVPVFDATCGRVFASPSGRGLSTRMLRTMNEAASDSTRFGVLGAAGTVYCSGASTPRSTDPSFSHAVTAIRGAGLSAQQAVADIAQQVSDQAAFLGVIDFIRASGWCLLALIPLIWLTKKSQGVIEQPRSGIGADYRFPPTSSAVTMTRNGAEEIPPALTVSS